MNPEQDLRLGQDEDQQAQNASARDEDSTVAPSALVAAF